MMPAIEVREHPSNDLDASVALATVLESTAAGDSACFTCGKPLACRIVASSCWCSFSPPRSRISSFIFPETYGRAALPHAEAWPVRSAGSAATAAAWRKVVAAAKQQLQADEAMSCARLFVDEIRHETRANVATMPRRRAPDRHRAQRRYRAKHKREARRGRTYWISPPEVVAAARAVMAEIDFGPASSPEANEKCGRPASTRCTTTACAEPWRGKVLHGPGL